MMWTPEDEDMEEFYKAVEELERAEQEAEERERQEHAERDNA